MAQENNSTGKNSENLEVWISFLSIIDYRKDASKAYEISTLNNRISSVIHNPITVNNKGVTGTHKIQFNIYYTSKPLTKDKK